MAIWRMEMRTSRNLRRPRPPDQYIKLCKAPPSRTDAGFLSSPNRALCRPCSALIREIYAGRFAGSRG